MKKLMKKYGLRKIGGKQKGFTLIELLIVLTILAILVAVVTLALTSFIGKGETEACEADADALQIAALAYYHDNSSTWPVGWQMIDGGYIDKAPDSDGDCDWGIGLADDIAKNRICYGATDNTITTCDCTEAGGADSGPPPCDDTDATTVNDLSPWEEP